MSAPREDYKQNYMVGTPVESYECPRCGSREYEENPLMQGGVNCMCKECKTVFHVVAF